MSSKNAPDDRTLLWRLASNFGHFWWDFLVGDTPEITAAVIAIVAIVALIRDVAHQNVAAYVVLVVLCVGALAVSAARGRKSDV
jgi:hypothetical protein